MFCFAGTFHVSFLFISITVQSSGEILNWIGSKVDQTNTFSICISRNDIYNRGMQQWQRQKKSSPKDRLKVTFFGEAGVDSGALSKEFLTGIIHLVYYKMYVLYFKADILSVQILNRLYLLSRNDCRD